MTIEISYYGQSQVNPNIAGIEIAEESLSIKTA